MEDVGPQSEGAQTADLMDFMDGDDLGDSETSNDGSSATDGDSSVQSDADTPQESDERGHPREAEADEVESVDGLADATPAQAQDANEAPSWEPTTPFTYTLGMQSLPIDGAVRGADGVVYIPPEAVEEVQRLLSRGRYHDEVYPREKAQLERRAREAETRFDANAVKAHASAKFFDDLVEKGPDAIVQFLSNWQMNKPQILAAQERAQAQELYTRAQQMQQGDPAENAYRQQEQKGQAIQQVVQSYAQDPTYKFLTNEEWGQFQKRLQRNQGQLFTTADRDYGPHETSNGIGVQKGALALNTAWLTEELTEFATMVQQARSQTEKVTKAQAFNQRQNQAGKRTAPQTGATTSTAAPRDQTTGRFKSGKQWRDHLMAQMGMVSATPE